MNVRFKIAIAAAGAAVMLAATMDTIGQQPVAQRDQAPKRQQEGVRKHEIIPGSLLMTSEEREQYRQRMAAAKSDEEREQLRARHYKAMNERARLHGLRLAEPPSAAAGGPR